MLVVGLTGGIGCGKSEVRRRLLNAGFIVLDADTLAKQLAETDPVIITKIKKEFGEEMYDAAGHLQRKALAAIVFNDRKQLEKLNGIIHPRVISTVERQIETLQQRGEKIVIVEAALHYEVHWNEAMDVMVVVNAPMATRIARVMQRDGVDEAAVRRRMANQLPLEEKVKQAGYVIENTGDLAALDGEVARLIEWLKAKSEGRKA
jgi:dephospho-CoA kinase